VVTPLNILLLLLGVLQLVIRALVFRFLAMLVMLKCDSVKKLDTHALLGMELSFNALLLYCFDLFYLNCMVVLMILIVLFCLVGCR
jgi:hypothetical protein